MFTNFIFSIGCFLFLVFALHMLFTKLGNTFLNKLLAIVMLSRGCQLTYILLVTSGKLVYVPFLFKAFNPLYFAAPACFYLYFKGFVKDESRLRKWEWLHFLPLLFALADMFAWYFMDFQSQQKVIAEITTHKSFFISNSAGIVPFHINLLLRTMLFLGYLFFSWKMAIQHIRIQNNNPNPVAKTWVLFLLIVITLVQFVTLMPFISKFILGYHQFNTVFYQYYTSLLAVIIFCTIIFILYNPKLLYGYTFLSKNYVLQSSLKKSVPAGITIKNDNTKNKNTKKQITLLSEEQVTDYKEEIIAYITNKKPYLNADFTLGDLAQEMNLPLHQCSYILNYEIGENFRDWINGYRIAHFIEEYPINSNAKTILALSVESGFKNKTTFYNSFKKVKGVLPIDYFRA